MIGYDDNMYSYPISKKQLCAIGISFVIVILSALFFIFNNRPVQVSVKIGNTIIPVIIADTNALREQGLSGMQSLPPNTGMFFIFPRADHYTFWMPDMHFPIDIIWINNGVITAIDTDVSNVFDAASPVYYHPPTVADRVLEVNAGFAEAHGIHVGDKVSFIGN